MLIMYVVPVWSFCVCQSALPLSVTWAVGPVNQTTAIPTNITFLNDDGQYFYITVEPPTLAIFSSVERSSSSQRLNELLQWKRGPFDGGSTVY